MSINLSDLTSPNNQDVLAEITSAADFLDPIGKLKNLSRSPNKGGHALQTVALNQPRALPLIKNPAGNLGGYLYIPDVAGNYATGPSVTIGSNETWEAEVDMVITQFGNNLTPFGGGDWSAGFGMLFYQDGSVRLFSKGTGDPPVASGVTLGTAFSAKYGYDGTNIFVDIDGSRKFTATIGQFGSITHNLELNQQANITNVGNYAIQKAKLTVNNAVVFDCDFNGSTSIRHGDTKFQASVGGPVSLTRAGQDPVTVVKKNILRFDGVNTALGGLLNQTIDSGYFFAAFSVLGNGGEASGRVFGINSTGGFDYNSTGFIVSGHHASTSDIDSYYGNVGWIPQHDGMFDDANGDILHEIKFQAGAQRSRANNADERNRTDTMDQISAEEFKIGALTLGGQDAVALDLEYLSLFPADSVPDEATATQIRNYINNRNNVFDLKDGFGYYFFDAQKAPAVPITSGSSSWNGRIVGSDNGDTDKYATQSASNDAPVGNGYTVTFADNTDHLDIPSTAQAGWQVVGTSLGTFAYRVNANAVTTLHLLGNDAVADGTTYRKAGDLYGTLLLPTSATGRDIAETKKLLTDRGATEQPEGSNYYAAWYQRRDIIEFGVQTFPYATNLGYAWATCISMSDFGAVQAPLCTNFEFAWRNTTALTSFPAGAKLGTEAANVNFAAAWRQSGLTSFPALDLSNGTNFWSSWYNCSSMVEFSLVQVDNATRFDYAWGDNSSLTTFPANFFDNWNPSSIVTQVFHDTWDGCSALSAISVENILTSIDASNQFATVDGNSGSSAIADAGIDIDYNTATGSLSAATDSAITSLRGKSWVVYINGVERIP